MSRIRRAAVRAMFAYAQFGLAIVTGIVLVPLILRHVGIRNYGLWLASGEVLAYASLVDLGVLGVLPWMLAKEDGRQDRAAMRALLANGLLVGAIVGALYAAVAAVLWAVLPSALHFTAADRAIVGPPLALLVAATVLAYPLRAFQAVLAGLQDVVFTGILGLVLGAANVTITVWMLWTGHGIYALAVGASTTMLVAATLSVVRALVIAPDLMTGWPRPTLAGLRPMLTSGAGVWFGMFGWQLLAASNGLVITYLGHAEWVTVYSCTAKLSALALQLTWVLPDSGLIGLAQLHGEAQSASRVRRLVGAMLQMHLLLAGAAACGLLAFNATFVTRWVGVPLFGGSLLNGLLALCVIVSSLVHGLVAAASVLGNRLRVGAMTLVHGGLQLVCAVGFGHAWGLPGIAAASLLTGLVFAVPAAVALLYPATLMTLRRMAGDVVMPWLVRIVPIAIVASAVGIFHQSLRFWVSLSLSIGLGGAYVWQMRALYQGLPFDPRWTRWLVSLKLMPAPPVTPLEQL